MIGASDLAVRHVSAEQLPELRAVLQLTCQKASLVYHAELPWHSATFEGARHTISLEFNGGEAITYAEAFIACLPEHEFTIPGKLCVDAAITHIQRELRPAPRWSVTLEMLMLDRRCMERIDG